MTYFQNPKFLIFKLTFYWTEEVKKRIIRYLFSNCPNCASTLVFLFFLDCFNCNIFSFLPVNSTPRHNMCENSILRQDISENKELSIRATNIKAKMAYHSLKLFFTDTGNLVSSTTMHLLDVLSIRFCIC